MTPDREHLERVPDDWTPPARLPDEDDSTPEGRRLGCLLMAVSALLVIVIAVATCAAPRPEPPSSGTHAGAPLESARPTAGAYGRAGADRAGDAPPLPATDTRPVSRLGDISHMGDYPVARDYLAIPCRTEANTICGITVELCGPAACVVLRQVDYGPSQKLHPDRIADVHPAVWSRICGLARSAGLCPGSWTAVTRDRLAAPTLPATSTDGGDR